MNQWAVPIPAVELFRLDGQHTNNYVEGWHSRLKKVVVKPHPNIFELIEVIKNE